MHLPVAEYVYKVIPNVPESVIEDVTASIAGSVYDENTLLAYWNAQKQMCARMSYDKVRATRPAYYFVTAVG